MALDRTPMAPDYHIVLSMVPEMDRAPVYISAAGPAQGGGGRGGRPGPPEPRGPKYRLAKVEVNQVICAPAPLEQLRVSVLWFSRRRTKRCLVGGPK
jgi:hypothetical protein